jgi:hemerythrin-like domain-containing protein
MAEHGVLKRVLLVYRVLSRRAHAGESVPAAVLHDAAGLIHRFIEGFHEALEETYIFPALLAAGRETALVKVLLAQHAAGRLITQDLLALDATGSLSAGRTQYATARLDAFVRMYEPHEAREDTVVFPAYRAITTDAALADMGERFADLQRSQLGVNAFADAVAQVSDLESQLGIADLGQFTPTLT